MSEPRDEREFTTDLELGTPAWLPGGKLTVHYRRLWDKRAETFISRTAKTAKVNEETLLQRVGEGDGFAEVFQCAGRRLIEDGDPVVHDVFTRLIAAAFRDDTRIHEVSYLLTKLEKFQAMHVRIVAALPFPVLPPPASRQNLKNGDCETAKAEWLAKFACSTDLIAIESRASELLVLSVIGEFINDKFVVEDVGPRYYLDELGAFLRGLIEQFRV